MTRVLILEDSEDYRNLLRAALEVEGFEVATAANGERALQLMARRPADLILTDLFMPDKDGLETIMELRERYPDVRIVAMSGWHSRAGVDYLHVAREIGAAHTLRKPFALSDLMGVLRQLTT